MRRRGKTVSAPTWAVVAVRRDSRVVRATDRTRVGSLWLLALAVGIGLAAAESTGVARAQPDSDASHQVDAASDAPPPDPGDGASSDPPSTTSPDDTSSVTGGASTSSQASTQVSARDAPPVTVSSTGGANTSINGDPGPTASEDGPTAGPAADEPAAPLDDPSDAPSTPAPPPPSSPASTDRQAPRTGGGPRPAPADSVGRALPSPSVRPLRLEPIPPHDARTAAAAPLATGTPVADGPVRTPRVVPPSPPAQAPSVAEVVATAGAALFAPFLVPGGDGTPTAPPVVWTVLAWTRREFDEAIATVFGPRRAAGTVGTTPTGTDEGVLAGARGGDGADVRVETLIGTPVHLTRLSVGSAAVVTSLAGHRPAEVTVAAGGRRATVVTESFDPGTGLLTTHVRVLDAGTGDAVGTPVAVAGAVASALLRSRDERVGAIDTHTPDGTTLAVVDLIEGRRLAEVTLPGEPGAMALNADGSLAVQATTVRDADAVDGRIAVVDVSDGTVLGTPLILVGQRVDAIHFPVGAAQFVVQTHSPATGAVRRTVVDTVTGDPVGEPIEVDGADPPDRQSTSSTVGTIIG